jgi:non-haem dioxygenase in morphine synthesis N-terminal
MVHNRPSGTVVLVCLRTLIGGETLYVSYVYIRIENAGALHSIVASDIQLSAFSSSPPFSTQDSVSQALHVYIACKMKPILRLDYRDWTSGNEKQRQGFVEQIMESLETTGFVKLINHGFDEQQLKEAFDLVRLYPISMIAVSAADDTLLESYVFRSAG